MLFYVVNGFTNRFLASLAALTGSLGLLMNGLFYFVSLLGDGLFYVVEDLLADFLVLLMGFGYRAGNILDAFLDVADYLADRALLKSLLGLAYFFGNLLFYVVDNLADLIGNLT